MRNSSFSYKGPHILNKNHNRQNWVQIFTPRTWQKFLQAGAQVTRFLDTRWDVIQRLMPKDYVFCYITGISRWLGIFEVQSSAYLDTNRVWSRDFSLARVDVRMLLLLERGTDVRLKDLRARLGICRTKNLSLHLISSHYSSIKQLTKCALQKSNFQSRTFSC